MAKRDTTILSDLKKDLDAEIKHHRQQALLLERQREKVLKELQVLCKHPRSLQDHKKSYYGGDYYNTAHTTHRIVCRRCERELKKWTEDHGWYG